MTAVEPGLPGIGEQALAQLQSLLLGSDRLEEFLQELVVLAADLLPVRVHCSITLAARGRLRTAAASDELVRRADQEQYDRGEGPCLEALRTGEIHAVGDMRGSVRFPVFAERALLIGLRSSLALPLTPPGRCGTGVMNLYADEPDSFSGSVRDQAAVFAGHAAGALGVAHKIAEQTRFSEDLQTALASRTRIDQAIGILMAQRRCTAPRAFEILARASQNRNKKVRDLAALLITEVSGAPPAPLTPLEPPERL
ncbi:GAF and ANTAR domain-containing protein [Streptomyces sp. NPDC050703]|uniref:GAF and ANTAR domain-containing protein n=1 Tax=Streptomyces sp. NPDC050703 TaxID=3157218 RepID=UPI00341DC634